ncbi:MAG: hypothetical protein ACD_60C00159G0007 [uncultured bacterium]|nr:MAG: hypothetical protein ACD_60C00159G0007 [uncultured bacterium]
MINKIVLIAAINLVTPAFAAVHFSPYADLTINAHWDSHYQDMEPMDITVSGAHSYHLAFITDAGACLPAWGGQSSYAANKEIAWGSHLTDKMRTNNIKYIISLGGATGNDLSKACSETQLMNVYEQIIQTYQPEGLDFDIENGTADVKKVMVVLQKIQSTHPTLSFSFTLPVLPEGLTAAGQDIVNQATAAHLNYSVNIMAMDYGPAYTNDMGQYAIQAATNLFEFLKTLYPEKTDANLWQMVEVTPMIGVNDVNVEQFTLTNVDTLRNFANQNNIGGLSMWSVARDNPCADKWASPICSGNNLQSKPYEFSERFMQ